MLSGSGWILCTIGIVVILIAAIGLVRLPDALSRQHAATKAGTVAVILFAAGVAMIAQDSVWSWRLLVIIVLLLLTLPLASHALSRAAAREMSGEDFQASEE
jgi:multicomponent Na+:H+ antiporter subunit G